ncbi:uncharacterized protein LOC135608570 isoform X2 [Musa acuminata AAA Group]|uniref:uncharacterized protein LOC135608570 isoform X2 n=1 Tax=Musa acuminata AAA Group TaxID=214697 RepID=UPI0031DEB038
MENRKYFRSQSGVSQLRWPRPQPSRGFLLYKRSPSPLRQFDKGGGAPLQGFLLYKRSPSPLGQFEKDASAARSWGLLLLLLLLGLPFAPRVQQETQKKNLIGRKFPGRSWALFTPCLRSIRFGGDGDGGEWKWKWNRYCDNTSLVQIEGVNGVSGGKVTRSHGHTGPARFHGWNDLVFLYPSNDDSFHSCKVGGGGVGAWKLASRR